MTTIQVDTKRLVAALKSVVKLPTDMMGSIPGLFIRIGIDTDAVCLTAGTRYYIGVLRVEQQRGAVVCGEPVHIIVPVAQVKALATILPTIGRQATTLEIADGRITAIGAADRQQVFTAVEAENQVPWEVLDRLLSRALGEVTGDMSRTPWGGIDPAYLAVLVNAARWEGTRTRDPIVFSPSPAGVSGTGREMGVIVRGDVFFAVFMGIRQDDAVHMLSESSVWRSVITSDPTV